MTAFDLVLDPSEVAVNRTELALNSTAIVVDESGIDWGDAAIQAYLADARVGSVPVGRRWPDRIVKIPLTVRDPSDSSSYSAAKQQIMQKVGQIQREGRGWLKRQTGLYADVVNATLTYPDRYGERFSWENGVVLQLECKPDFYGDEITLDSASSSNGIYDAVLEKSAATAVIDGAQDARCRIIITDTSGNDQNGVWWGVRSQYYDSASTAKLFYEAEALTPINGSTAIAHTGMSGSTTVRNTVLPAADWMSVLVTDLKNGSQLTHRGAYRVIARAYSATATPQLRLLWGSGKASTYVENPATVALPGTAVAYEMDLGVVRLAESPVGDSAWRGVIQAYSLTAADPIELDRLSFVPVEEGAGSLNTNPAEAAASIIAIGKNPANSTPTVTNSGTGTSWTTTAQPYTISMAAGNTSKALQITNHGFALPGSAVVKGIMVQLARQSVSSVGGYVSDLYVQLLQGGSAAGGTFAHGLWPTSADLVDYGGPTSLWNLTWTESEINASGFGFQVLVTATGTVVGKLEYSLAVYYSLGTAFASTPNRVMYADESLEIRTDGAYHTTDGTTWSEIVPEDGDLPRIPAAGLEDRSCELFVATSRGNLISQGGDSYTTASTAFDAFTTQVKYQPCWLFAP